MLRKTLVGVVMFTAVAGPAFAAECSSTQTQEAGKLAAALVRQKVSEVVPVDGKQFINLNLCDVRGGQFKVDFRYNFTGADGLYWLEGEASFDQGGAGDVKSRRASDNLRAAASGKGSMLLASR